MSYISVLIVAIRHVYQKEFISSLNVLREALKNHKDGSKSKKLPLFKENQKILYPVTMDIVLRYVTQDWFL